MIWFNKPSLKAINDWAQNTLVQHLGIAITEVGDDYLQGAMPVDDRTRQPIGLLHGGASCVLAETLGSIAASLVLNKETHYAVGLDINANHTRAIRDGVVTGTAKPLHIGRSTQVWDIQINDEAGKLVCVSRLTVAVLKR